MVYNPFCRRIKHKSDEGVKENLILGIVWVYPGIPGYEEGRIGRKLNIRMLQRGVVIGRHCLDMAMLT